MTRIEVHPIMAPPEDPLDRQFTMAMLDNAAGALRLKPPLRSPLIERMIAEHGGKETANRLLATSEHSKGFTELFLRGKENLKLSLEYLVLRNPWRTLFDVDQLEVARRRLREYGCDCPLEDTE
jgi:hypothetical protein